MLMTKDMALTAISQISNHFELNELIDRLLLIKQIEKGREQNRNGQVIPFEKAKRQVASWREQLGASQLTDCC